MKKFDFDKAVNRYNAIMMTVCYEHSTIGTNYSEGTEDWNIRDMVAECDYVLSTYYEVGHCNEELRHSEEQDERKVWYSETGKLSRFIKAYEPFIQDVVCAQGHCSRFDNYKDRFKLSSDKTVEELISNAVERSEAAGKDVDSVSLDREHLL